MIVAVFVMAAGWSLGRRTIDTLTDAAPVGTVERVRAIVSRVPGVSSIDRLRVRPAGSVLFIEVGVGVSRTLPIGDIVALKDRLVRDIEAALPTADVSIAAQPRALDDETVIERVMAIARDKRLAVHHITVQRLGERLAIALDLEVDGRISLEAAHLIATDLEDEIRLSLGGDLEVETHIEPMQVDDITAQECPPADVDTVRRLLEGLARQRGDVGEVHQVRARRNAEGVVVNFHCRMAPGTPVEAAHHAIDDLERNLRQLWPEARRVVGHVEPAGVPHAPRRWMAR
jgi:divalent metal cation (Fe/Co/Zn/Cd) transporter